MRHGCELVQQKSTWQIKTAEHEVRLPDPGDKDGGTVRQQIETGSRGEPEPEKDVCRGRRRLNNWFTYQT